MLKALESRLDENFQSLQELLEAKGWLGEFRNEAVISQVIDSVIEANPKTAQKFSKSGKSRLLAELTQQTIERNNILDGNLVKAIIEKKLRPQNQTD